MTVTARKTFVGTPADTLANYHGEQLNYFSWDHHLMFAAPFILMVPPSLTFGDFIAGPISTLIAPDPDAGQIDWTRVEWFKSNRPFQPDFSRTLAENGVLHKEQIRLRTPGLNTLGADWQKERMPA